MTIHQPERQRKASACAKRKASGGESGNGECQIERLKLLAANIQEEIMRLQRGGLDREERLELSELQVKLCRCLRLLRCHEGRMTRRDCRAAA